MSDHTWNAMFNSSLPIRLNCILTLLVLLIYRQSKMGGLCLHNDLPAITPTPVPSAATSDKLCEYVEATWIAVLQRYIQSLFYSIPKRVAVAIANNDDYTNN
ncbi:hypothetical protein TNCV_3762761 [Trichonephila clavipes]|nr:hypothetical protein TNCV_3762761 [Trichonephila clavipes]